MDDSGMTMSPVLLVSNQLPGIDEAYVSYQSSSMRITKEKEI